MFTVEQAGPWLQRSDLLGPLTGEVCVAGDKRQILCWLSLSFPWLPRSYVPLTQVAIGALVWVRSPVRLVTLS